MSYENTIIREATSDEAPNHDDACPVCDKIECVCKVRCSKCGQWKESSGAWCPNYKSHGMVAALVSSWPFSRSPQRSTPDRAESPQGKRQPISAPEPERCSECGGRMISVYHRRGSLLPICALCADKYSWPIL